MQNCAIRCKNEDISKNYFDNAIASIIKYFFIELQLYNNEITKLNNNLTKFREGPERYIYIYV